MERFIFEKPKTVYDVESGKKTGDGIIRYLKFANGWSLQTTDAGTAVFDADGREIARDVDYAGASANGIYYLKRGDVFALFAPDGRVLAENASGIEIFANGWIEISSGGKNALYRPDMSLAAQGYANMSLMEDGFYYLTEDDSGKWSLFLRDGTKRREGFVECKIVCPDFYFLDYGDRSFLYDDETGSEVECTFGLVKLFANKMFTALKGQQLGLYRSNGELVLNGYDRYDTFANGMYVAGRQGEKAVLFYPDGRTALENVLAYREDEHADYIVAAAQGRCMLFGENAEALYSGVGAVMIFTGGWFGIIAGEQLLTTLYRADKTVAASNIIDAEVYSNGWYQAETQEDNGQALCSLYDNNGKLIVKSAHYINFDELHLCYAVQEENGKQALKTADGKVLRSGFDKLDFYGELYVILEGNRLTLYSFEGKKLYSGTRKQFLEEICLYWYDAGSDYAIRF